VLASILTLTESSMINNDIKKYFGEKGFEASEIPKAIAVYEILGLSFLVSTWSICYQLQPHQSAVLKSCRQFLQRNEQALPKFLSTGYQNAVHSADSLLQGSSQALPKALASGYQNAVNSASSLLQSSSIPGKISEIIGGGFLNTEKLVASYIQSSVFRKACKPVTIPAKIWLTWKILHPETISSESQKQPSRGKNNNSSNNNSDDCDSNDNEQTQLSKQSTYDGEISRFTLFSRLSTDASQIIPDVKSAFTACSKQLDHFVKVHHERALRALPSSWSSANASSQRLPDMRAAVSAWNAQLNSFMKDHCGRPMGG